MQGFFGGVNPAHPGLLAVAEPPLSTRFGNAAAWSMRRTLSLQDADADGPLVLIFFGAIKFAVTMGGAWGEVAEGGGIVAMAED